MRRIVIGGTHSGCGKTTVTCAVLSALKARGLTVASFKCGPDYIDPMFHRSIIGTEAHNLDSFFCRDDLLRQLLYENGRNADISVIEGVMGFYDGADGRGSAHSVSVVTESPAVITVDCKGAGESIGAVVKGFLNIEIADSYWLGFIDSCAVDSTFGLRKPATEEAPVVVEYSSPNTNKPLHLGHIRNNLLGWSVSQLLAANGANVKKVNLVK